ncbi:NADH:flavin oxidoreductase/NADH oxidase family protein [Rhizobium lusitanum]|uniref:NADH:flavin oxidoreductase/NADH oxidase family protein n=1 Tax=Rhizobium lusitanum TaxID=293958 RepID=UPI00195D935F|nr:NADH:flavin oxidoreductase/NADH oxidase family protein [Rhizobium lusitanum]MBM7048755.1 NADH:flavin oxidoreductase/NADH oxidase family protein [Rhizobium lusitanum]
MFDTVPVSPLFAPLTLPNGAVLTNRLAKAAMEENMADHEHLPGKALCRLYAAWSKGGVGLILSGNVMIDPTALTGPGGVVLDASQPLEPFREWARAARSGGNHAWLQISHPGRQVMKAMGQGAVAPSAIGVQIEGASHYFPTPRALEAEEIATVIERFATAAAMAEQAGFTGVEIHAAHGYLISQFLSPLSNRRTDEWGGSLANRAQLLLEVVKAVRARVSPGFCVGVKLNSADFQKGGFAAEDAVQVVRWLNDLPVDLVELSGGSYESPAMAGAPKDGVVNPREAYFVDFAREIGAVARMPIMVTGGIHRRTVAERALEPKDGRPGVAVVGIATALAFQPTLPMKWRAGAMPDVAIQQVRWKKKVFASLAAMAVVKVQLHRIGAGRAPKRNVSPLLALIGSQLEAARRTRRYKAWIARRGPEAPEGAKPSSPSDECNRPW